MFIKYKIQTFARSWQAPWTSSFQKSDISKQNTELTGRHFQKTMIHPFLNKKMDNKNSAARIVKPCYSTACFLTYTSDVRKTKLTTPMLLFSPQTGECLHQGTACLGPACPRRAPRRAEPPWWSRVTASPVTSPPSCLVVSPAVSSSTPPGDRINAWYTLKSCSVFMLKNKTEQFNPGVVKIRIKYPCSKEW